MAQIFVSGVAHFFVVVGGSKIHERLAHFFIDIYMQIKEINATKLPDIGIKRVAAYARVSSEKGETLHSLSAQISYYNEYISNHIGWEFAGVYADEGISGTKDSRPEFQRLLTDCR